MGHVYDEVDRLIDERPGKILLKPVFDKEAVPITDFIYKSSGATACYMLVTSEGRVILNTGRGPDTPHHRAVFDRVLPGPTRYIITMQGHHDHVGGVAGFREPARSTSRRRTTACSRRTTARSMRCTSA